MLKKKLSQTQSVMDYLDEHETITCYEAFLELGITQLGARIFELKKQGYKFNTTPATRKNKEGVIINYTIYSLS